MTQLLASLVQRLGPDWNCEPDAAKALIEVTHISGTYARVTSVPTVQFDDCALDVVCDALQRAADQRAGHVALEMVKANGILTARWIPIGPPVSRR